MNIHHFVRKYLNIFLFNSLTLREFSIVSWRGASLSKPGCNVSHLAPDWLQHRVARVEDETTAARSGMRRITGLLYNLGSSLLIEQDMSRSRCHPHCHPPIKVSPHCHPSIDVSPSLSSVGRGVTFTVIRRSRCHPHCQCAIVLALADEEMWIIL